MSPFQSDPPAIVQQFDIDAQSTYARKLLEQFAVPKDAALEEKISESVNNLSEAVRNNFTYLESELPAPMTVTFGESLLLKTQHDVPVATFLTAALSLNDPRLITEQHIAELIRTNPQLDQQTKGRLSGFLERENEGSPQFIQVGVEVRVQGKDALRYDIIRNEFTEKIISIIPDNALSPQGRRNKEELLNLLESAEIQLNIKSQLLTIEESNRSRLLPGNEALPYLHQDRLDQTPDILRLEELVDRATKSKLPARDVETLQRALSESKKATAASCLATVQQKALRAELSGDLRSSLEVSAQILTYVTNTESVAERTKLLEINGQKLKNLAPKVLAKYLDEADAFSDVTATLQRHLSPKEQLFAEAQAHDIKSIEDQGASAKNIRTLSNQTASIHKQKAIELYRELIDNQLTTQSAPEKERSQTSGPDLTLIKAIDSVLEHGLRHHVIDEIAYAVNAAQKAKLTMTDDYRAIYALALESKCIRACFEHPDRFRENELSTLFSQAFDISPEPKSVFSVLRPSAAIDSSWRSALAERSSNNTEVLSAHVESFSSNTEKSNNIAFALYCLSQSEVALSRVLVSGSVSPLSASEREKYFHLLTELNSAIREREQATLRERSELLEHVLQNSRAHPTDLGLQVSAHALSEELRARTLALAQLSVHQAEVALAGNTPTLLRTAKQLIADLEQDREAHPAIAQLVRSFKEAHESPALIAAIKEFLAEVNKDYPPDTIAAMIALGLVGLGFGARYGWKGALHGSMFLSCATLAAVKGYFGLQGLPEVAAAWETHYSSFGALQSSINGGYLWADVVQAIPLGAALVALSRLRREGQSGEDATESSSPRESFARGAATEVYESAKSALSLLIPNSLNSVILYSTAALVGSQMISSDLPIVDITDQAKHFGREVGVTVAIAVIQARMAEALLRSSKRSRVEGSIEPDDVAQEIITALNSSTTTESV
jgi:hypothetical protein